MPINSFLQTGDEIISSNSQKSLIKHHGVAINYPNDSTTYIVDNNIGQGVGIHSLKSYLRNNKVIQINKRWASMESKKTIRNRINSTLGTPYSLLTFNCEHFSNFVRFGKVSSKQVIKRVCVIALFIAIFYIISKWLKK